MNYKWSKEQLASVEAGDTVEVIDRFHRDSQRKVRCKIVVAPNNLAGFWTLKVEMEGKGIHRGIHCCDPNSVQKASE